jgi:dolichyl-diphosphooligosaccharide--protein glycosyltransferase
MPPGGGRGAARAQVAAAALGVALLAVAPRVAPQWSRVVEGGRALVRDPDACYHLRRAERIAAALPDLALRDPFVNSPEGAWVIWPPLYDLVLAGAVAAFPSGSPLPGPGAAVALLPPLLFAGAALALFALARRLWPGRGALALLAAGAPALLPANAPYTTLGQLDHHAAELLCVTLFLLALGDAAAGARPGWRCGLWTGAALAAALLVQLTLVILVPLLFVPALCAAAGGRARALETAAAAALVALALVSPWGAAYHVAGVPYAHYRFGLFQPALLALGLAVAVGLRAAVAAPLPGRLPRGALAAAAWLAAAGLAAVVAPEALSGAAYATRTFAPWQETIGESRSLLAGGWGAAAREVARTLSCLAFLAPVAAVLLARDAARGDARRAVLLAALLLFATLAVLQARFLAHVSLLVGIVAATVAAPLLPRAAGGVRAARAAAVAGAILLALAPARRLWGARDEAAIAFDRARPLLDHLAGAAQASAADSGPHPGAHGAPPPPGVLAEWSYGHFIQYHGRHPAIVDNFGSHVGDPTRVRAFFLETDEARALAFADSVRARYVLVADLPATFGGMIPDAALIRRFLAQTRLVEPGQGEMRFREEILPTLLYRLTQRNGAGVEEDGFAYVPPLAHAALVAESVEPLPDAPSVPLVKLYEIVPGARARVEGLAPGAQALLLATIRSPRGRAFPYVVRLRADAEGVVEAILPYPTEAPAGSARAVRCEIDLGGETIPIAGITPEMVRSGATLSVGAPRPAPPQRPSGPRRPAGG